MKSTKYFLGFLLFFLFPLASPAQGIRIYKGDTASTDSSIREFTKVRVLSDGSLVYAGQADEGSDANFSLTKTTPDGAILWQQTMGTEGLDVVKNFIVTSDGGFLLVGWTDFTGGADFANALIIRCNSAGTPIWSKQFGGADDDEAFNATQLSNGDFLITGTTYSFGPVLRSAFACRLDAQGDIVWSKGYGQGTFNYFIDAMALPNDEAILCGYTFVTTGTTVFDPYFVKIQSDGTPIWSHRIKMNNSQIIYDYERDLDGGIVYAGVASTATTNQNFIGKISSDGAIVFNRNFGTPRGDRVWDLSVLPTGDYITVGFTDKILGENSLRNGFINRISSTGNPVETIQFGVGNDTSTTTFTGVALAGDFLVAAGFTYLYGNTRGAGISVRIPAIDFTQNCGGNSLNMTGTAVTATDSVGVQVQNGGVISDADINNATNNLEVVSICSFVGVSDEVQAFKTFFLPNPSTSVFSARLPREEDFQVQVISADGRKVLDQSGKGPDVRIDLSGMPAGLFSVILKAKGGRITTGRLVLCP